MEAIGTIKETGSFLAGAETILVRPRTAGEFRFFREFLEKVGAAFETAPVPQRAETLEGKITRLYAEGHYGEEDLRDFLSIPKEHRTDPFDIVDSGDVYYADRRNVDYVNESIALGRKDMEEGRTSKLDTSSFDRFLSSIRDDGREV